MLETAEITKATKDAWAACINARFTGTFPVDEKGEKPKIARFDREASALMTMRGRYAKLFIHFRVTPDKKWLAKVDPEEVARLEAERDAVEAQDFLLTAVEIALEKLND